MSIQNEVIVVTLRKFGQITLPKDIRDAKGMTEERLGELGQPGFVVFMTLHDIQMLFTPEEVLVLMNPGIDPAVSMALSRVVVTRRDKCGVTAASQSMANGVGMTQALTRADENASNKEV